MKTCGVVEEDKAGGYKVVAEPMGIVAAVIPTTNPTSTAIFKSLLALKTRNAILISPHPRAKGCTIEAARIVRDAAEKAGCPKGIIDWVPSPTIELTAAVMAMPTLSWLPVAPVWSTPPILRASLRWRRPRQYACHYR